MTDIVRRTVLVKAFAQGPTSPLVTEPDDDEGVDPFDIQLTEAYLRTRAGLPYVNGRDFSVKLSLLTVTAAGVVDGIDLSTTSITMRIWDGITRVLITTKLSIVGGDIDIDGTQTARPTGNRGDFVVNWLDTETTPAGLHRFEIEAGYFNATKEIVGRGVLEVLKEAPS